MLYLFRNQQGAAMRMELSIHGSYTVIHIREFFDIRVHFQEFEKTIFDLLNSGKTSIAVMFSQAEHLSSSLISVLIHFNKDVLERNGKLCIVATSDQVREMFSTLNLHEIIPIVSSVRDLPD